MGLGKNGNRTGVRGGAGWCGLVRAGGDWCELVRANDDSPLRTARICCADVGARGRVCGSAGVRVCGCASMRVCAPMMIRPHADRVV